jgi:hypothetical protein
MHEEGVPVFPPARGLESRSGTGSLKLNTRDRCRGGLSSPVEQELDHFRIAIGCHNRDLKHVCSERTEYAF